MAKDVDARGRSCPIPIVELSRAIKGASVGEEVRVLANDNAFVADVRAWCERTGNSLIALETNNGEFTATIKKLK